MKYRLLNTNISTEQSLENDEYKVTIYLNIEPIDGIAPIFSKLIEVISTNSQTGFEVDTQRQQEIQNYINQINQ